MRGASFARASWVTGTVALVVGLGGCGGSPGAGSGGAGGKSNGAGGGPAGTATGGRSGSGGAPGAGGTTTLVGSSGCPLFTTDDAWNVDVTNAPVDAAATTKLMTSVGSVKLHPDFGAEYGIPINVVPAAQPLVPVTFDTYADESDPGPYALPDVGVAKVEGTTDPHACDGDCHLLVVQQQTCTLFEGWQCRYQNGWVCSNGARWDLKKKSYGQRPDGWTSADAAGLPIYAGLARYEEVMAGAITHAIRFTVSCSAPSYIAPATHAAGNCKSDPNAPPMGLRVRMKASYDGSALAPEAQIFVAAFKKYGMILADNGSNFYFQSEADPRWSDGINDLKKIPSTAFEVVTTP